LLLDGTASQANFNVTLQLLFLVLLLLLLLLLCLCHCCCCQVSLSFAPKQSLVAGLAIALLLGGVANGVAPKMWQLPAANPLYWLNHVSYTR
jgi:hypothetical protein